MLDDVLVRRFRNFAALSSGEEAALRSLSSERGRMVAVREDIVREGDQPRFVHLILQGWAARYKVLEDGRRQILAFLLPGDLCDVNNGVLREMDHSIAAITPTMVAQIGHDRIEEVATAYPRLARAFWWHMLCNIAIQREWTVNIGQRTALERIGHLFCETFVRLRSVGLTRGTQCDMPMTQSEIGEATGLTSVHVNRTLQELRATGLISLRYKVLDIPDFERLKRSTLFSPTYLHLAHDQRPPRAVPDGAPALA